MKKIVTILALILNTLTFGLLTNVPVTIAMLKGSRRIKMVLNQEASYYVRCACFGIVMYSLFDVLTLGIYKWVAFLKGEIKEIGDGSAKGLAKFSDELWVEIMSDELEEENLDKDKALELMRLMREV